MRKVASLPISAATFHGSPPHSKPGKVLIDEFETAAKL